MKNNNPNTKQHTIQIANHDSKGKGTKQAIFSLQTYFSTISEGNTQ